MRRTPGGVPPPLAPSSRKNRDHKRGQPDAVPTFRREAGINRLRKKLLEVLSLILFHLLDPFFVFFLIFLNFFVIGIISS